MKPEQITAWALNEASAEDRQQLEAALLENPQDKQKADETKAFCDFLLSELRDDSLALTDKQRERLVAQASGGAPASRSPEAGETPALRPAARSPQTRWRFGVIVRLSIAACAVLGGFWTWQTYSHKEERSNAVAAVITDAVAEKPAVKVQLAPKEAKKKAGPGPETRLVAEAQKKALPPMEPKPGKLPAPTPVAATAPAAAPMALSKSQSVMTPGDVAKLKQIQDQNAYALNFGDASKTNPAGNASSTTTIDLPLSPKVTEFDGFVVISGPILSTPTTVPLPAAPASAAAAAPAPNSASLPDVVFLANASSSRSGTLGMSAVNYTLGGGVGTLYLDDTIRVDADARINLEDLVSAPARLARIDGYVYVPGYIGTTSSFAHYLAPSPYAGLLPGRPLMRADGWPLRTRVQFNLALTSGEIIKENDLAGFHPDIFIGDGQDRKRFQFTRIPLVGRAGRSLAMALNAARGTTGSVMVDAGVVLTMSSLLRANHNLPRLSTFNFASVSGSILEVPDPYSNADSTGLLSFATAPASYFIDRPQFGVLGGLSPDVIEFDGFINYGSPVLAGTHQPVDLMKNVTITTKSGTRATMEVSREFVYPIDNTIRRELPLVPGERAAGYLGNDALVVGQAVTGTGITAGTTISSLVGPDATKAGAFSNHLTGGVTVYGGVISSTSMPATPMVAAGSALSTPATTTTAALPGLITATSDSSKAAASTTAATIPTQPGANANTLTLGQTVSGAPIHNGYGDTWTLSGANTYTGGTVVGAGVLTISGTTRGDVNTPVPQLANTTAFASAAAPAAPADATMTFGKGVAVAPPGKDVAGAVAFNNTFTGGVVVNGGVMTAGTGALTLSGAITPATAAPPTTTVTGTGGVAVTKSGAGILTLNGGTTYTGSTTISGGALSLTNGAPAKDPSTVRNGIQTYMGASRAVPVDAGATLDLNGNAAIAGGGAVQAERAKSVPGAVPPSGLVVQSGGLVVTATTSPASPPVPMGPQAGADTRYFSFNSSSAVVTTDASKMQETTAFRRTATSGESYTRIIENEMKDVAREPLSTLSIDVDTASYANVRRFLNQNMIPPPDAVRIEELVNYFPTSEEGPAHEAKEPFSVRVDLAPCPWQPVHRLARIAIKGRELDKNRKASNLVFLVDVSGSMNEPAKLPLVQQSLRMLTEQLGEGDHVTIVVYAGSSGVVLPPTSGLKKAEILAAIDRLRAGGSTHGSAGIKLAYEQAVDGFIKGGINRVILCTDGDFNVGVSSPEELEKLIKHKAKTGVFLSVLGFGSGNLQDRTMETLADKGNGNYAYIDSLSEARKVLVEQMGSTLETIAKDVKIQVEFNPAAVRSYRLIGYENRLLAKEDFNDDTKDAGEIGAGHSVVALYELVPTNLPPGADGRPSVDALKYQAPAITPAQLAEAAKSGETMTVKLRYKAPDSDLSKLIEVPTKDEGKTLTASTDEYKFSAAVAGFGLLLRDSAYKGTLTWETVRRLALDGKGQDKLGYRGEFLQLIDKARGLKETR